MSFTLTNSQKEQIKLWSEIQDKKVAFKQLKDKPNYGSCGGAYSYIFVPTTIGLIVKVKNTLTGETLDISEDF